MLPLYVLNNVIGLIKTLDFEDFDTNLELVALCAIC